MHWYNYLCENIMFTNKWDVALFWENERALGAGRVALIKSLIYPRKKGHA